MRLPTLREIDDELVRRDFAEFIKRFWGQVEQSMPLVWTWHFQVLADHFQAITDGKIARIVVNIPPGHGKSIISAVLWPAWEWLTRPGLRSLFGSYAYGLAERDSIRCRELIRSEEYRRLIPRKGSKPSWALKPLPDRLDEFHNTAGGFRQVYSSGGKATGLRGHKVVMDDPINVADANSTGALREAIRIWDQSLSSRFVDPRAVQRVLIMQRLNVGDLAGHCLNVGGYDHLSLPSEARPLHKCCCPEGTACSQRGGTSIGFVDPRDPGQLLNPVVSTADVIAQARRDLGSFGYAGQHDQMPTPLEGGLVRRENFGTYAQLPGTHGDWAQSWDLKGSASKLAGTSYCCGWVLFRPRGSANVYVVDRFRDRVGIVGAIGGIRRFSTLYPTATIRVENKALGPAAIEMLHDEIPGVVADDPDGSKVQRFVACQPMIEAGNVLVPEMAPWLDEFMDEITAFPNGLNDDQVDALTQQLLHWRAKPGGGKPWWT
uniref:Putative terminase n=1 Tax=viral metagenome TaxID=1070528 RepID=A0A6H1ZNA3_9ZZZZ